MKLYKISEGIEVIESSIHHLFKHEAVDSDPDGYTEDGSERHLVHGISPNGDHQLWVQKPSELIPITGDPENDTFVCEQMTDNVDEDNTSEGIERILGAISQLRTYYQDNALAQEKLDRLQQAIENVN